MQTAARVRRETDVKVTGITSKGYTCKSDSRILSYDLLARGTKFTRLEYAVRILLDC